jgi:transcriptional regulator with XRE-family HTH domain
LRRYPVLDRAITDQIAKARQAAGFSQRELSSKLGRRNNYIQNIESGGQSVTASELHAIASECGSTGAELLSRAVRAAKGKW